MAASISTNPTNNPFFFKLLEIPFNAFRRHGNNRRNLFSCYTRAILNQPQDFLPSFLPSFGWQRDDRDKGVSFNELGLGALGVQGQILVYIQDTRPEFLTTAHLHEELGKRRILGIRSEALRRDGALAMRMRGVRYFRFCARGGDR